MPSARPIKVFVSDSHRDEPYCRVLLDTWLVQLTREKLIEPWTDHKLIPGDKWNERIRQALDEAELILFLVSQDFVASEYIHTQEYQRAIERERLNEVRLVPIILRRCDWTLLSDWQCLPPGGMPVSKYADPDDAWFDVLSGIKKVIEHLQGEKRENPAAVAPLPATGEEDSRQRH